MSNLMTATSPVRTAGEAVVVLAEALDQTRLL